MCCNLVEDAAVLSSEGLEGVESVGGGGVNGTCVAEVNNVLRSGAFE